MFISNQFLDFVLQRRGTFVEGRRPLTTKGRANAVKHLIRIRDRCPPDTFLTDVGETLDALTGVEVTQLKDLYKIIAFLDVLTPDEANEIFSDPDTWQKCLLIYRTRAQNMKPASPDYRMETWANVTEAVGRAKSAADNAAIVLSGKIRRDVHIPRRLVATVQTWLLAAIYVYHPPRRNEYSSLLLRGFDEQTDNYLTNGRVVLNTYSTSYCRGTYIFHIPAALDLAINALSAWRFKEAGSDRHRVHLFACADGSPLLSNAYTEAVTRAFILTVGAPLHTQMLGQFYVDHHDAAGTLPSNVAQAMGRRISPSRSKDVRDNGEPSTEDNDDDAADP